MEFMAGDLTIRNWSNMQSDYDLNEILFINGANK